MITKLPETLTICVEVNLDRAFADKKLLIDRFIAKPLGQKPHNIHLAFGQSRAAMPGGSRAPPHTPLLLSRLLVIGQDATGSKVRSSKFETNRSTQIRSPK